MNLLQNTIEISANLSRRCRIIAALLFLIADYSTPCQNDTSVGQVKNGPVIIFSDAPHDFGSLKY